MPKEPKITKFVVNKPDDSAIKVDVILDSCEVCGTHRDCIRFIGRYSGNNIDLCLPCIKGLSEVAKELK